MPRRYPVLLLVVLGLACSGCSRPGSAPPPSPSPVAATSEPALTVSSGQQTKTFSRSELLKHPALQSLTIPDKSAYQGSNQTFQVVPLSALFAGTSVPAGRQLHYETSDGFSSSLPADQALTNDTARSIAYLAIETPDKPWPKFENRTVGAGPFYLVWSHPELSNIGREEWPFQLRSFSVQAPIEELYPAILPNKSLPKDGPEWRGYHAWVRNCFPCHTMNGQGAAHFGPDLNRPMNPTQYFKEAALKQLIRNPRSVRTWTDSKMSPFGEDILSNRELDDIVAYLKQMALQPGK